MRLTGRSSSLALYLRKGYLIRVDQCWILKMIKTQSMRPLDHYSFGTPISALTNAAALQDKLTLFVFTRVSISLIIQ